MKHTRRIVRLSAAGSKDRLPAVSGSSSRGLPRGSLSSHRATQLPARPPDAIHAPLQSQRRPDVRLQSQVCAWSSWGEVRFSIEFTAIGQYEVVCIGSVFIHPLSARSDGIATGIWSSSVLSNYIFSTDGNQVRVCAEKTSDPFSSLNSGETRICSRHWLMGYVPVCTYAALRRELASLRPCR